MLRTILITSLAVSALSACGEESTAAENVVEVYLSDMLDNVQNGYCLDIARAQGDKANPDDGLQGHTCYSPSGSIGVDQAFDPGKIAEGTLYMPNFDVCVDIPSTEAGASIALAACDGSSTQAIAFSGNGTITPASAPELSTRRTSAELSE